MGLKCADVEEQYKKFKDLKKEDVKCLMEWMEKQPHLPKMTELETLLFLHSCYNSQEQAKITIDNYFTNAINVGLYHPLKGKTREDHQVIYCRLVDFDPSKYVFADQLKLFTMIVNTWCLEEGAIKGHHIVFDMEGVAFGHLTKLGLMTMKKYMYYLQEAMPVRLKGLHFVNVVPFMDKILAIMKPFMKKELMDVLYLHTDGIESFQKFIEQKNLPKQLGGEDMGVKEMHESMKQSIIDNMDYYKAELKQRVDETLRPGKAKNAGDIFGVEGTFKKLDID